MKKNTIILIILTIVSKLFGFVRELTLSYYYGASGISDAYLISLTIPSVIFSFVGTGLYTGYIPMYNKIQINNGKDEADQYTLNLINVLIIFCTIITILVLIFTEPIVKMFAIGFEGDTLALAVRFSRISIFGIYFTALMYVFNGYLRLHGDYVSPGLTGFPLNIITILAIFLSAKFDLMVLAIGSLIAISSQFIMLIPFSRKKGLRYRFLLDLNDQNIREMIIIALPTIIGASIDQVNILIDKTMASSIAVGGVSALNYGSKLNGFIHGIFVSSISTVMYPAISKMAVENNFKGMKATIKESINMISLLVAPAALGCMVLAEPIVEFLFARGAFDIEAKIMTASVLFFYSVGSLGYGFRNILSRAFYSMQDTKTPMINGTIGVLINIILNFILSRFMGLGGLALASSTSAIVTTILLGINLRNRIGRLGIKDMAITLLKILSASGIMGITVKLLFEFFQVYWSFKFSLLASIGAGIIVYGFVIYYMKIQEVYSLIQDIKNKIKELKTKKLSNF